MLTRSRFLQSAAAALIVSCGTVVATDASAQNARGHDRTRHVSVERHGHAGSVRVEVSTHQRSSHHADRGHRGYDDRHQHRDHREPRHYGHRDRHQPVQTCPPPPPRCEPTGYWRNVYHPPVYRTVYDACGYPRQVLVRRGYYERVWVEHRGHGHRRVY